MNPSLIKSHDSMMMKRDENEWHKKSRQRITEMRREWHK